MGFIFRAGVSRNGMRTIELDEEVVERIETHLEDDETVSEFVEELIAIYEQEGRFLQEGA